MLLRNISIKQRRIYPALDDGMNQNSHRTCSFHRLVAPLNKLGVYLHTWQLSAIAQLVIAYHTLTFSQVLAYKGLI